MVVVFELDVGRLYAPGPLDIDGVRAVDHDLGDAVVGQQRLDGSKAEDLGHDLFEQALAVIPAQHQVFLRQHGIVHLFDRLPHLVCLGDVHLGIKLGEQLVVDAALQILIGVPDRRHRLAADAQILKPRRSGRAGGCCARLILRLLSGQLLSLFDPFQ